MEKIKLSEYAEIVFQTPSTDYSEWFGYYNYDTLNLLKTRMLCNRVDVDGVEPRKGKTIELGYYDLQDNEWHHVDSSDSWNWQQGAMMQWLPDVAGDRIIYNLSKGGDLASSIYDVSTGKKIYLDWPIYGITPDGKKSISIDLERSYWCRAYHYQSVAKQEKNVPILNGDGVFEIDLVHNTKKLIVPLTKVMEIDPDSNFQQLKHWLEHVMISPNGKRFCFLHRFSPIENTMLYQTRLCIANIDGTDLQVLPCWRDYSLSHFGWKNDEECVIYAVKIPSMQKTLTSSVKDVGGEKSIVTISGIKKNVLSYIKSMMPRQLKDFIKGDSNSYQYYTIDEEGKYILAEEWKHPLLNIDGHPSFTADGRYMITDSYPDRNGYQRLVVYDTVTKKGLLLAEIYAYYNGNPASCDLHPKLCRDNEYVAVDTAYDDKHHMMIFKLDWVRIKSTLA